MAVTINASTSSGLQISSDTSGVFEFQSNGTAIQLKGTLLRAPQVLTSGTSYTTPANCTAIYVELLGGGGGGGGANFGTQCASGGAAGAYAAKYFTVTASTAYTYAIGAAGSGGAAGFNPGTAGGNTTFTVGATTVTATGGTEGRGSNGAPVAAGVTPTNSDISTVSQPGYSLYIGASGYLAISAGGSSIFGGGAVTVYTAGGNGSNATGYGSGGSGAGAATSKTGGNGYQGLIRIWEYA